MVALARPPTRSSLKVANHFVGMLRLVYGTNSPLIFEPCQIQSPSLSPITHGSSSSSPSLLSPLSSSFTHSELKTWLFGKFFPP